MKEMRGARRAGGRERGPTSGAESGEGLGARLVARPGSERETLSQRKYYITRKPRPSLSPEARAGTYRPQ
jgi:hypothetical protein